MARTASIDATIALVEGDVPASSEATTTDDTLIEAATKVGSRAHAPYSKFTVGAAVLTRTGQTYVGCNVENMAYPVGVCAERNAIGAAVASEGPGIEIAAIAVAACNAGESAACSPCGACRQAIAEFGFPAARVLYRGSDLIFRCDTIETLLPGAFSFKPVRD